jgi:cobyrinic acid a,c-diamide synthase
VIPRVVVAGARSGGGKTTIATGPMATLADRDVRTAGSNVGPDFIDPSYHGLACGRSGRNLDAVMSGADVVAPLFRHGSRGTEIAVVEGVMGLFDRPALRVRRGRSRRRGRRARASVEVTAAGTRRAPS